jgi:hypothetical protein
MVIKDFTSVMGLLPQYAIGNAKWYMSQQGFYSIAAKVFAEAGGSPRRAHDSPTEDHRRGQCRLEDQRATASGLIDTLGYDWCTIDIIAATADVVSNKPTVLKLQEADTTDATNLADVSASRRHRSLDRLRHPERQHGGDRRPAEQLQVQRRLPGRKRYLSPTISPATTQVITIIANLGRGEQSPVTAAKANAMTLVEG